MTRESPASASASAYAREERTVRRQREVEVSEPREQRDQAVEFAADERLAARDAELLHAVRDESPRDPLDLLERE